MVSGFIVVAREIVRPHVFILRIGRVQQVALLILQDIFPETLSVAETALQVDLLKKPPYANLDRRRAAFSLSDHFGIAIIG